MKPRVIFNSVTIGLAIGISAAFLIEPLIKGSKIGHCYADKSREIHPFDNSLIVEEIGQFGVTLRYQGPEWYNEHKRYVLFFDFKNNYVERDCFDEQ